MAGVKGRGGGKRSGSGAKKKADLIHLHELIDARVGDAVWNSIIDALAKKARKGDAQAFRASRCALVATVRSQSRLSRYKANRPLRSI